MPSHMTDHQYVDEQQCPCVQGGDGRKEIEEREGTIRFDVLNLFS
jgi:hypothetical protein